MVTKSGLLPGQQATFGRLSGTLFENVYNVLAKDPIAQHFFTGEVSQADWINFLDQQRTHLVEANIPSADVDFAKRYPGDRQKFIEQVYQRSEFAGTLTLKDGWFDLCQATKERLNASFEHDASTTYIYPEEGYMLLTLAQACAAKRAIFLGSYYGYWAAWVMPVLQANGGSAVLLDPDPSCCELAQRNLTKLYPEVPIEVATMTGQEYLETYDREQQGAFDFVVLDAELPPDYPDEALRGKGLYRALLDSVLPYVADRSLLVCHNILLNDTTGSEYLQSVMERNQRELAPFLKVVQENYQFFTEILTTEGMGVGLHQPR